MRVLKLGVMAMVLSCASLNAFAQKTPTTPTPIPNSPVVNFCTARHNGNYEFVGNTVATNAKGALDVFVVTDEGKTRNGRVVDSNVTTQGSLDNLALLEKGLCDVAIVQSDAWAVYAKQNPSSKLNLERGLPLYNEYLNLICHKDAKISKITELNNRHTVYVGSLGSGSSVTWEALRMANPAYAKVETQAIGGIRAGQNVAAGNGSCVLYVTGLNDNNIKTLEGMIAKKGDMFFVNAFDSSALSLVDPKKKPLYSRSEIPGGTYPKMQLGVWSSELDVLAVSAIIVSRIEWLDANPRANETLNRAIVNSLPTIKNRVGG